MANKKRTVYGTKAKIPADALFVNTTILDNDLLLRSCKLNVDKRARILHCVFGTIIIAVSAYYFFVNHGNAVAAAVVAAIGVFFYVRQARLASATARGAARKLDEMGDKARVSTYYFTASEFGTVMPDGSVAKIPYAGVEKIVSDNRMYALVMNEGAGVVALDRKGFTKGDEDSFFETISKAVADANAELEKASK